MHFDIVIPKEEFAVSMVRAIGNTPKLQIKWRFNLMNGEKDCFLSLIIIHGTQQTVVKK